MAQYRPHCPKKHECSKKGANLGWYDSKERAQDALKHHLTASDKHQMDEDEAAVLAELDENIEEWLPSTSSSSQQRQQESLQLAKRQRRDDHDSRRDDARRDQHRREESSQSWRRSEQHQPQLALGMGHEEAVQTLDYVSGVMTRITEKVGMAVAAVRTAATFARQAENAFNTEANNLQLLLEQLQQLYSAPPVPMI